MSQQGVMVNVKSAITLVMGIFIFTFFTITGVLAQEAPDELPPVATDGMTEVDQMKNEREQFVKEIRRVENLNKKYTKEIDEIRAVLADKDANFQERMKALEAKLAQQQDAKSKNLVVEEQAQEISQELVNKTNEMLSRDGDLDPEDQQFKQELAKAHYNMGNIYYERAEYQRAVVEYYQAVDLMPNDADTHYNLALVSGEYLGDQETALKHYQWYLYLKPNAPDAPLVKKNIMTAKLHVRSRIDSRLDKDNGHYNLVR